MGEKATDSIQEKMVEATELHSSGNVEQASRLYGEVLLVDANHADANHLLGLAMHQLGKSEEGLSHMFRGIELNPKDPGYRSNYGSALKVLGRFEEAIESFEIAMEIDPKFLAAIYNAGEVYCALDRLEEGEEAYRRASEINPNVPEIWSNLGVCLAKRESWEEALVSLERSLALDPSHGVAHFGLGHVYDKLDRFEEAQNCFAQAINYGCSEVDCLMRLAGVCLRGGFAVMAIEHLQKLVSLGHASASLYNNMALAYQDLGDQGKAYHYIERALSNDAMSPEALNTKASMLVEDGRFEEAVQAASRATASDPKSDIGYNNMGTAYRGLSKLSESKEAYEKAIAICSTRSETHNNLGLVLNRLGDFVGMASCFEKALELDPRYVGCMSNYASALIEVGKLSEAESWLSKAIEIDEGDPAPWGNLGRVRYELGDFEGTKQAYLKALKIKPESASTKQALASTQIANDKIEDQRLFEYHVAAGAALLSAVEHEAQPLELTACLDRASRRGKLRLGFVSSDFRIHSVAYFLLPLFEHIYRDRFEICCYSGVARPDETTARFQTLSDVWRSLGEQPSSVTAQQIREDQIDVLFDISGYTSGNSLEAFARKPAPVQVTWLGYAHSTGLESMDYRIVDEDTDEEGVTLNSEKLVCLPTSFVTYQAPACLPEVAKAPSSERGCVTFASYNNIVKLSETTVEMFAATLLAVEGSRLILKSHQTQDAAVKERVLGLFEKLGIDRSRIELMPRFHSLEDHFNSYAHVDVALDTYPYNGTTTTCEALSMGVPVVTMSGKRHAARVGRSLLNSVGLPDLVVQTPEEFASVAKRLAEDSQLRAELRSGMRERIRASSLGDASVFARNMELAIEGMWSRLAESNRS